MSEWLDKFLIIAQAIAKDLNCTTLRGFSCRGTHGKDAWLRALNKNKTENKWEQVYTCIEMTLSNKEQTTDDT